MGDLLGYARVSTTEQKAHLQTDALKKAGCIRVWTDKASGSLDHRPKLEAVLDQLRPGDTLVVWRLDRLGRNLRHLIATVNDLAAAGVGFKSLTEGIDTTTPAGASRSICSGRWPSSSGSSSGNVPLPALPQPGLVAAVAAGRGL